MVAQSIAIAVLWQTEGIAQQQQNQELEHRNTCSTIITAKQITEYFGFQPHQTYWQIFLLQQNS